LTENEAVQEPRMGALKESEPFPVTPEAAP
jgi:hypothetical protein